LVVAFDGGGRRQHLMEATQQPAGAARGQHNERTRGRRKGRQHNNQLIFCRAATLICGIVICRAATALPGNLVCHAAMETRGIVFSHMAMMTARNRAMMMVIAVALEDEVNGKGRKSDGDGDKENNGER
jgi:hypothetical protein